MQNIVPSENEQVNKLQLEWREQYAEGAALHAKLKLVDEGVRYEYAQRILELDQLTQEIWRKLDYFKDNGVLPEEPKEKEKVDNATRTTVDLIQRRNTLRSYISKANKGKKPKEHIPKWEIELKEVEELMNGR